MKVTDAEMSHRRVGLKKEVTEEKAGPLELREVRKSPLRKGHEKDRANSIGRAAQGPQS